MRLPSTRDGEWRTGHGWLGQDPGLQEQGWATKRRVFRAPRCAASTESGRRPSLCLRNDSACTGKFTKCACRFETPLPHSDVKRSPSFRTPARAAHQRTSCGHRWKRWSGKLAELAGLHAGTVKMVGETSLAEIKTRPDYAVTQGGALSGFIEIKAPGKGADPRRFGDRHDREQWAKLQTLPNLIYTDGNGFSLWRNGSLEGEIVRLEGDVKTAGAKLAAPDRLVSLFSNFFQWEPEPPRSAQQLAGTTARLCRLLREEVTEQLRRGSPSLTNLATDWRKLLFPSATDEAFADGYAQAVTFGLLMARAREIVLDNGLDRVAKELRHTNTLIGTALRLLTDDADSETALKTSLTTLTRVLNAVHWPSVGQGNPDAWLYFYEDFLSVYDNDLRKKTGSYYTPPEVVRAMVRLVDEALRSGPRFALSEGLASPEVTVADPATGTGTFLLGVLSRIAQTTTTDQGPGAVPAVIEATIPRLIGFEMQFGPFAVAQLRLLAELQTLLGDPSAVPATRLYVTDTLGNPYAEEEHLLQILRPLGESRRRANAIKRQEKVTVVIGNPPYKEKAKGLGGWIESGSAGSKTDAPLRQWMPPASWRVGTHAKHLRNLYVYFWRWATWKVFGDGEQERIEDHAPKRSGASVASRAEGRPADRRGIVSFITVAGFLNGPGFQKMRAELRRDADEVWIIDCSPEGHQPEVPTRIFQGVQQPVCIVMALRSTNAGSSAQARVRYRALPAGTPNREVRGARGDHVWTTRGGRNAHPIHAPRSSRNRPEHGPSSQRWKTLYVYDGSGVMPGRTWVIAPDRVFAGATVGGASIRSRCREEGERCSTRTSGAASQGTSTSTNRLFRRDYMVTSSALRPSRRIPEPSSGLSGTDTALSIASGSSPTDGSSIGPIRPCGRHIRTNRCT